MLLDISKQYKMDPYKRSLAHRTWTSCHDQPPSSFLFLWLCLVRLCCVGVVSVVSVVCVVCVVCVYLCRLCRMCVFVCWCVSLGVGHYCHPLSPPYGWGGGQFQSAPFPLFQIIRISSCESSYTCQRWPILGVRCTYKNPSWPFSR